MVSAAGVEHGIVQEFPSWISQRGTRKLDRACHNSCRKVYQFTTASGFYWTAIGRSVLISNRTQRKTIRHPSLYSPAFAVDLVCFTPITMRGLKDKRVLITGGASGIGAATAVRFVEEGSRVVILDRDAQACEKLQHELPGMIGSFIADVSNPREVEHTFGNVIVGLGGLDVVINNAGISVRHKFLDITVEEWSKVLAVNLSGVFYIAQAAARYMMQHNGGVILNMASTNGIVGQPFYADYNATKAGVIELTKSMALELAPKVRVNAVAPGYVLTPMQRAEYTDEMLNAVNQKIPLRRHADSAEIGALFAYLASDDASYITGSVHIIDGGEIAGGLASR